jgi:hypothetical protein
MVFFEGGDFYISNGIMVNLYQVPHMEWFGIMEFLII